MYDVKITKVATGETRTYHHDSQEPWSEDDAFIWEDGNYACDCNRYLFFERAGGREPGMDGLTCGDGAYTVVLPNGTVR